MTAPKTKPAAGTASRETFPNWAFSWDPPASGNPWAWDGLAPFAPFAPFAEQSARAALAGVEAMEGALAAWRHLIDVSRSALREQQDVALDTLRTQLNDAAGAPKVARAQASGVHGFFAPMFAAARAYEHLGEAVLDAQRGAFEALSTSQRPH
jgi:hypothetical protein